MSAYIYTQALNENSVQKLRYMCKLFLLINVTVFSPIYCVEGGRKNEQQRGIILSFYKTDGFFRYGSVQVRVVLFSMSLDGVFGGASDSECRKALDDKRKTVSLLASVQ